MASLRVKLLDMQTMMVRSEEPGSRSDGLGGFNDEWGSDRQVIAVQRKLWAEATPRITALEPSDLDGRSDEDIALLIVDQAIAFPTAGPGALGEPVEDTYFSDGLQRFILRFPITWLVGGCAELLGYWPWKSPGQDQLLDAEQLQEERQRPANERRLGFPERDFVLNGSRVTSFIEVFETDEGEPDHRRGQLRRERERTLEEFIAVSNDATRLILQRALPDVAAAVEQRRRQVEFKGRALTGLPLALKRKPSLKVESTREGVSLPVPRLQYPAFENVIETVVQWGAELQKYPRYLPDELGEDGYTAFLCAALTIAFGIADHDTFVHNGHADIHIPLGALKKLGLGESGDQRIFVAEAKKGSGPALAVGARGQIDNYLATTVPDAALIFYIDTADHQGSIARIIEAVEEHEHTESANTPIAGASVFNVKDPLTRAVRKLAIVGIPTPAVDTQGEEAKKRASS